MTANLKPLTPGQQRFAELVAAGVDQTNAYRQAFPGSKAKPETLWVKACQLAKQPHVATAITDLVNKAREKAAALIAYDLQDAVREAHEAYELAKKQGRPTAMYGAVYLKAKLLGLLAEDRKNDRTPLSELTDDQLAQQVRDAAAGAAQSPQVQAALREALGVIAQAKKAEPAPAPAPQPAKAPTPAAAPVSVVPLAFKVATK